MTNIEELGIKELGISLPSFPLKTFRNEKKGIDIKFDGKQISLGYCTRNEFFRGIAIIKSCNFKKGFSVHQECNFDLMSIMLDNSRNAVMKVDTAKLWIRNMAMMGYNQLQIYTEDTFEVDDNPYFGYQRGRFTQEEIKEIVEYGEIFGIEVIPAIQTLAHFTALKRWNHYQNFMDINDIMLVDDNRTYELIEKILVSVKKCYKSNKINIGMDEAFLLGRGKFIDKNGYEPRFEIICRHLSKVLELVKKYGFEPMMWSDMFFRSSICPEYFFNTKIDFTEEQKKKVPADVKLIYWDYYGTDKAKYDNMIRTHKQLNNEIYFAGGVWTWMGFAPLNKYSIESTKVAFKSCIEGGIKNVIMTLWGDDTAECHMLTGLPTLSYASEIAYNNENNASNMLEIITGINLENWLLLDLPNQILPLPDTLWNSNCSKYYLYNDYFLGLLDGSVKEQAVEQYRKYSLQLNHALKEVKNYKIFFELIKKLCDVLEIKSVLGIKTRKAYKNHDIKELQNLLDNDYKIVLKRLKTFYECERKTWYLFNKGFGFEIQDVRLGGLIMRTKDCMECLRQYISGKVLKIEELENDILPYQGNLTKEEYLMSFGNIYSPSDLTLFN